MSQSLNESRTVKSSKSGVIKEGWLNIKGEGRGFIEVTDEALVLRKHRHGNKEELIPLSASTRVHIVSKSEFSLIPQTGEAHCFRVPHGSSLPDWVLKLRQATCKCTDLSMDSFQIRSVLGRGFYGKVVLCQRINTTKLYAIKSVHKSKFVTPEKLPLLFAEKAVLCRLNHPFIVRLGFCFDSPSKVYFGLEYVPGGELTNVLKERELTLSEVRLYVAQITLALLHIHENSIVYCDLKPGNVLIDGDGYLKLIDFGLSHICHDADEQLTTFCGTAEYISPEMIRRKPYNSAIDWWSLGILTFKLLTGRSPFKRSTNFKTYQAIVCEEPKYRTMDPIAIDFISKLLKKDPKERMTDEQVLDHPFFNGIDFTALLNKTIKMPFIPPLVNGIGIHLNREESAAESRAELPDCDPAAFAGLTFTNQNIMMSDVDYVALDVEL